MVRMAIDVELELVPPAREYLVRAIENGKFGPFRISSLLLDGRTNLCSHWGRGWWLNVRGSGGTWVDWDYNLKVIVIVQVRGVS
jgi:hypothetical protein